MEATVTGDAVKWILNCSVSDVNWDAALKRLTNDELFYCLETEKRTTARRKLNSEVSRRGLVSQFLKFHLALKHTEEPPTDDPGSDESAETFSAPYVGESGPGTFFLMMESSRKGRKCIGRKFPSREAAMEKAEELMGQVIDIEPVKGDGMGKSAEVEAVEEVYQQGRKEGDKALAILESERFDCEAIGKIKAANFNIKSNELLKYVTLYQIKQDKEYRKAGRTWEEFCRSIGESDRTVDRILSELTPIIENISATQAEVLGMPLSKIRYLGRSISANVAEISDNAVVIADQRIEILPENKDELEAAIDLMREAAEKERQLHAKEVEKLKKKVENAATEETKTLTAERDALVKELTRLKVFDPEGKDTTWSNDQIVKIQTAAFDFSLLCRKFVLDDRLEDQVELQATIEGLMTQVEMSFRGLRQLWDERFNANFGE